MSTDDPTLRRLQELETKVSALETTPRRFPGWLAVLAVGFFGGWLSHFVTEVPFAQAQPALAQDVVAKSLRVVNDQGKTQIALKADNAGGIVHVFNAEGKAVVELTCDADGGVVKINGPNGTERAFLGCGDRKGGGLIYFRNADGKGTPVMIAAGNRGGYITLNNLALNKRTIWIGTHEDGDAGAVQTFDRQGFLRSDLGCNKQGGMVNLLGHKRGKAHAFLGAGELDLGGLLLLKDDDGKVRAEMGQGKNGGYLHLNGNKNERPNVALETSPDQRGGFVQVRDVNGQLRAEMAIDATGQGYVNSNDGK